MTNEYAPAAHRSIIEIDAVSKTTFAAAQNAVPVIRGIKIHNTSELPLSDLRLSLRAQPAFVDSKDWTLDHISAGQTHEITRTDVTLNFEVLDRLNEAEHGQLTFMLHRGDQLIAEHVAPIELLARDEWGGVGEMGQLLAAFVAPNDSAISAILKDAARLLERQGKNGAINGYQSEDPKRSLLLANAIWNATVRRGISYAEPPKSFEQQGQKVRAPGTITSTGLATCLDLTLLLAAAFEAAGLNPAVILTEGHAFVGVWIVRKSFNRMLEPDAMEVRKAVDARELVVLESTLLTQKPGVEFKHAISVARPLLAPDAEKPFRMAVDITKARGSGIRPLSSTHVAAAAGSSEDDWIEPPGLLDPETLGDIPANESVPSGDFTSTRLDRWQNKLLDLTLRNRLLNFKPTRQTLKLACHNVAELEDALAKGDRFRIVSMKSEDPVGSRDPRMHLRQTGKDIERDFARTAFAAGEICATESEPETQARLTTLHRKAKSDLAEGGANTLFMAVGFLRWRKEADDDRSYRAPLLLLPITLNRRSVKSPYFLSHHSDDIVFNQTLLEFLEQDFGIEIPSLRGPLPEDDSGLDISLILDLARQGVRDASGFEVIEDIAISTFSFAKYLMWKDLRDRTATLKQNRLVAHLLDHPDKRYDDGTTGFPVPRYIDERANVANVFTPLPADSSQLAAVLAAEAGKDFVIIGPPGTGKSQTIANMIAHCLAHGKTVLFVAEKAAALDVVHRRLKAHGLADACLELHSNKADRRNVLAQLGAAWDRVEKSGGDEWKKNAERLRRKRDELNRYVSELHALGSHGRSIYEGIGVVTEGSAPYSLKFQNTDAHDAKALDDLVDLVDRLNLAHEAIRECASLQMVDVTEWSFFWQADLLQSARAFRVATTELRTACGEFTDALGIGLDEAVPAPQVYALANLCRAILGTVKSDARFLRDSDPHEIKRRFPEFENAATAYQAARNTLSVSYDESKMAHMPLQELDLKWRRASTKIWPLSWLGRRSVRKMLQTYAEERILDPANDLRKLVDMQEANNRILETPVSALPGFNGAVSNVNQLRDILELALQLSDAASETERAFDLQAPLIERLDEILAPARESDRLAVVCENFQGHFRAFVDLRSEFEERSGRPLNPSPLQELEADLDGLQAESGKLNDWVKWSSARHEADRRGLLNVVKAFETGVTLDPKTDFLRAYFSWWLPLAIDRRSTLRTFTHWEHDDRIQKFRDLVEMVQSLAAAQVREAVAGDLPPRDEVPRASELGLLRHQLGLKRPSKSIRDLIGGMPETLTALTPCVLMSPLSVAQFLTADRAGFDIVIFDEASQITTWDAIGAIARGKQSIIVGDPKQLPPTNFFGRTDEEEDEELEYHEQDLPSILDEASAAGLKLHQLNWHYRSRDEGLIAFSNHHYYEQRLVTFPSPRTDSKAVQFHSVQGVYARGSGRTNEIEARAVVDFILQRLEEWLLLPEDKRLSIGVITFNAPQQELILDILDDARSKRSHLEWFFSEDREEPVMVKNLENVQGDERDVMVFSITFGPDASGKLAMDFGAVNREGGEKRLNVAVTRAKSEFHVFSSIAAEDIDLRRTGSLGVQHLKNYLDYAARGAVALPAIDEGLLGPADSPFEASVADALRSRGWDVRAQIGVSGFRIDLGIVHPDRAGSYLAGIECDGANYHSSATARDRDQIREGVLRNLGWEILRIWSTDWFMNPKDALQRVDERLQELLEESRQAPIATATPEPLPDVTMSPSRIASAPEDLEELGDDFEEDNRFTSDAVDPSPPQTDSSPQTGSPKTYSLGDQSRFFEQPYTPELQLMIAEIVEQHAPIAETILYQAVAKRHGWGRAGRRIQDRVRPLLQCFDQREEGETLFIWKQGTHQDTIPFRSHLQRDVEHIPREEILGLIHQNRDVLRHEDPPKAVASLLGFGRLRAPTRANLESCLEAYRLLHSR